MSDHACRRAGCLLRTYGSAKLLSVIDSNETGNWACLCCDDSAQCAPGDEHRVEGDRDDTEHCTREARGGPGRVGGWHHAFRADGLYAERLGQRDSEARRARPPPGFYCEE